LTFGLQELHLSGQKVMYDSRVKCCVCVECLVAAMHRSISSMKEHAHMEQCNKQCANGELFEPCFPLLMTVFTVFENGKVWHKLQYAFYAMEEGLL